MASFHLWINILPGSHSAPALSYHPVFLLSSSAHIATEICNIQKQTHLERVHVLLLLSLLPGVCLKRDSDRAEPRRPILAQHPHGSVLLIKKWCWIGFSHNHSCKCQLHDLCHRPFTLQTASHHWFPWNNDIYKVCWNTHPQTPWLTCLPASPIVVAEKIEIDPRAAKWISTDIFHLCEDAWATAVKQFGRALACKRAEGTSCCLSPKRERNSGISKIANKMNPCSLATHVHKKTQTAYGHFMICSNDLP